MRTTIFTTLRIAVAGALLAYLALSGAIEWQGLRGLIAAWPVMLAAGCLYLADVGVTAARLSLLMGPAGFRIPFGASFRLALVGLFFSACLPGNAGGDVVRIYYASAGQRSRVAGVATVIMLDRAIGLFAMVLWPLLAAPLFPSLIASVPALRALLWIAAAAAAAMAVGFAVACSERASRNRLVNGVLDRLPLGGELRKVADTLRAFRSKPGVLAGALGVSLVAHTIAIGVMLMVALAVSADGFSWRMAVLAPFGFLANQLPLTPGGLGVGEAAFSRLFEAAGLRGGAEMMLGWRLIVLVVGLLGVGLYLHGRRQLLVAQPAEVGQGASVS